MSGTNQWTPLGPDCIVDGQLDDDDPDVHAPVSGRVTSLVVDGDTVYVGTAGGGVWRSDDVGVNWRPIGDSQACLAVGAMVLDAAAHRLYIGTGEGNSGGRMMHGQGLLIYDTQAGSFLPRVSAIPTAAPQSSLMRVSAMVIEPAHGAEPQRLWMATNRGAFWSSDQGQTWQASALTGATTTAVSSLAVVQDTNGQQLLATWWGSSYSTWSADGTTLIPHTADGGVFRKQADQSFQPLDRATPPSAKLPLQAVGRIGLAVAPGNPQRVYALMGSNTGGSFQGLYRSNDGGVTWAQATLPGDASHPLKQSFYNLVLAVDPANADTLLLGEDSLWRSTDGGQHWTCVSQESGDSPGTHADQHVVVFDAAHPGRVWAGNDGGVWLSTDGGLTWAQRNRGLGTVQFYAIAHHAAAESVLLGGTQDNGTSRFSGQAGWNLVGYGDGFFCGIDRVDPRYWYSSYTYRNGSGQLTGIQRSDRAGALNSWRPVTSGIDPNEYASAGDEPFYVPFVLDPITPSTLYLGTTRLWRSVDRGQSWQAVAQADGTVFTTATSVAPAKPSASEGISCIAVDPNDANIIYVGTFAGAVYQVHLLAFDGSQRATNASWSVRALPPAPATPFVQTPNLPDLVRAGSVTDLAVPKLAAAGTLAQRSVHVAYGSDYLSSSVPQRMANGRVWKVDFTDAANPVWAALGSAQLQGQLPEAPHIAHELNFANALVFDPDDPQHLFVGCHVGVFESTNGGGSWSAYASGLPNVPVVDLQLHPTHKLLRAATMGRGCWERPLAAVPAGQVTPADIFIRDDVVDLGRTSTTAASAPDPLQPDAQVSWMDGADIKVDARNFLGHFATPGSTQDYTAGGPMDYIGFQALVSEDIVQHRPAKVYVQVGNRGPGAATGVQVGLYIAKLVAGNPPALPANFWTLFPDGDPAVGQPWSKAAAKVAVGTVPAGSARIAGFQFDAPADLGDYALMAVVTSTEDPLQASGTDVATVAQASKFVAVRKVSVSVNTAEIVVALLAVAGIVGGAAAGLALAH